MIKTLTIAAALVGGALIAAPASAAPLSAAIATAPSVAQAGGGLVDTVQWRGYGYGPRYYGPRYGGYYRGPSRGAAVGAGIAAGALGALAAGAIASQARPVYVEPAPVYGVEDVDAVAYCSRRFKSYDPETGTYVARGGVVRACP